VGKGGGVHIFKKWKEGGPAIYPMLRPLYRLHLVFNIVTRGAHRTIMANFSVRSKASASSFVGWGVKMHGDTVQAPTLSHLRLNVVVLINPLAPEFSLQF
jgi:hypothetical protein